MGIFICQLCKKHVLVDREGAMQEHEAEHHSEEWGYRAVRAKLKVAEARCAELEARVRELEDMRRASLEIINEQRGRIVGTELRLAALTEAAREAVAVLTNRDRTTHRGLQWAYDLAARLRVSMLAVGAAVEADPSPMPTAPGHYELTPSGEWRLLSSKA